MNNSGDVSMGDQENSQGGDLDVDVEIDLQGEYMDILRTIEIGFTDDTLYSIARGNSITVEEPITPNIQGFGFPADNQ